MLNEIITETPTNKVKFNLMVEKTKFAVHCNANGCKDLVTLIVFDTKLIYFLSTTIEELC